jgi:N-acetylneuraminate synthase/N,N'-diacetyllegionaminate synthase
MLRELELSAESHKDLMQYCAEKSVLFMSSPFDEISADLLDDLNVSAFKIPSGEITNLKYLAHVARKGRPMIVSTGMANLKEVSDAVQTIQESGSPEFILLQCVSNYPASPEDANLRAMSTMASAFGVPVGYSDHTLGISTALAAVALGACVIEKHLTLDKQLPGPDHLASLEPHEFKTMVEEIRSVESSLGHGRKEPVPSEVSTAAAARKSLVAVADIPAGTILTEELVAAKRPGTGLSPAMLSQVLKRKVRSSVQEGALITMEMFE